NVTPGTFFARGHDYRADLARMVSEAYGLPVGDAELLAIEHALRRREAMWAERRLVAEQLRRAKETVQRQTKGWGLTDDTITAGPGRCKADNRVITRGYAAWFAPLVLVAGPRHPPQWAPASGVGTPNGPAGPMLPDVIHAVIAQTG